MWVKRDKKVEFYRTWLNDKGEEAVFELFAFKLIRGSYSFLGKEHRLRYRKYAISNMFKPAHTIKKVTDYDAP